MDALVYDSHTKRVGVDFNMLINMEHNLRLPMSLKGISRLKLIKS